METTPPDSASTPSTPPSPPYGSTRPRELRRRPREGHLGGVCAGLAEYFAIDVVIVRIAAVVLGFSGPGIPAYVLAWIFVPEADDDAPAPAVGSQGRSDRGAQVFGVILLAVAVSILWGGWWSPVRRWAFPLALIALGAWLVLRRSDETSTGDPGPHTTGEPSADPSSPPPAPSTTAWTAAPVSADVTSATSALDDDTAAEAALPAEEDRTVVADPDDDDRLAPSGAGAGSPTPVPPGPPLPPWAWGHGYGGPPPRHPLTEEEMAARRRRKMVFPSVLGALLVWTGVAFLTGTSVQTSLAVALCIVGLGFVLGAFVGGSRALIVPAVLLTAALIFSTVFDLPMSGPVGERTWVPETVDQLEHYELSIGEGTLDLTELSVPTGEQVEVRASVGIGHLVVVVPDDVALEVYGEASLGDVTVFGRSDSGWGPSTSRSFSRDRFDEVLALELEVGIGQVEVISARDSRDQRIEPPEAPEPIDAPEPATSSTLR